jgi:murein DD-endopeptidase MepM/ murein hydrolase activator NlpD
MTLKAKYFYNQDTLRFERKKLSFFNVLFYLLGLLCFGVLFFIGLVFLQNHIIETPIEKSLRAENKAMRKYKVELVAQLESSKAALSELRSKDKALYERIFSEKVQASNSKDGRTNRSAKSNREILLADIFSFGSQTTSLQEESTELNAVARIHNQHFSTHSTVKREDVSWLMKVPSFAPVADFDPSHLVSGYGIRINPFHKGKYHHDGIDIASSRGSKVLASAAGLVTLTKKSDLQAGYGNYIEIDHGNGYASRYANLGEVLVKHGQKVEKGQAIGVIGISGGSIAPHVHYEVLKNGSNLDPAKYLVHGLTAVQYEKLIKASQKQNQSLD